MSALLLAQLVRRLGLDRVAVAVELLPGGQGGQQQRCPEARGEPGQDARALTRAFRRPAVAEPFELVRPPRGVAPFGFGEMALIEDSPRSADAIASYRAALSISSR